MNTFKRNFLLYIEKAGLQTHTSMIHPLMFTKVALSSNKKWLFLEKFLSLFTKEQGAIINILIVHVREINTAGKKGTKGSLCTQLQQCCCRLTDFKAHSIYYIQYFP